MSKRCDHEMDETLTLKQLADKIKGDREARVAAAAAAMKRLSVNERIALISTTAVAELDDDAFLEVVEAMMPRLQSLLGPLLVER